MAASGKRSLKSKLLTITATIMLLMSVVTLGAVAWMNYATEHERLADVENQIRQSIRSKGETLTESHALALKSLVTDNAFSDVSNLVARATGQEDVVYGAFISAEKQAWAYVSPTTKPGQTKPNPEAWKELGIGDDRLGQHAFQRSRTLFGREILEFGAAVLGDGDERLGTVVYGLSTERTAQAVTAARARSRHALGKALSAIGAVGFVTFVLGIALVRRAAAHVIEPIAQLTVAANEIAGGQRGIRVSIQTGDEVEVLAGAFNHMLHAREEAMKRLEETTERAVEADRMKSEFLANMSHEIRTPMNGVLGVVKLMKVQPLEGKLWRYVETIDASASALLTIINDILDLSKLEAGKYTIQSIPFQPETVLSEAAELLAIRAHDKNVELVYRIDRDVPAFAVGDPDRLKQVLTNLMGNAIKFTDKGEVFVNMTVAARDESGVVLRFSVQDSGIGIDSADLPTLYDKFSQVDGSMVRRHGGTGLGLAISKRLVKMMGGDIDVQSKVGVGSIFTFTVKLGLDADEERARTRPVAPLEKRVLVVEASRWREIVAEHLDAWGMRHEMIDRGSVVLERLEQARAEGQPFDVLVLGADIQDVDVPELIRTLRDVPAFAALPIILLSKMRSAGNLSDVERDGIVQLPKPIRFSELYNVLANSTPAPRRAAPTELGSVIKTLGGKRVLVVDDNEVNQFVASEQLEQLGYRVEVACNGLEALEKVRRGKFAAVLMDCQMPVMDGYTATREIRKWEEDRGDGRHVPIIALTAHALVGERERVLTAGMDDYLSKPCRLASLEKLLKLLVGDRAEAHPSAEPGGPTSASRDLNAVDRSAKLSRIFLDRVPEQLTAIDEAVRGGDVQELRAHAHKLKGSCLAIEAPLMSAVAEALQKRAESGDLSDASQLLSELRAHYARVEELLQREIADRAVPATRDGQRVSVPPPR